MGRADDAYTGLADWARIDRAFKVVKKPPNQVGFKALPQGLDRPVGAQQRVRQLEQGVCPPGHASVELLTELRQHIDRFCPVSGRAALL